MFTRTQTAGGNVRSCGETTANKDGIIQGHRDVPLSEVGMEQANLVAKRLQNEHFTHIFASDLKRAAETAQAIVKAGPENHCPIQLDKRLRERVRNRAISFFHDLCELVGKQDLAVDGEYTPASIKSKRRLDNGLSNGSQLSGCCIPSSTRPQQVPLVCEKDVCNSGSDSLNTVNHSSHNHSSYPSRDGIEPKRPRTARDFLLDLWDLEPASTDEEKHSPFAVGFSDSYVINQAVDEACLADMFCTDLSPSTMARSNSSASSGCSSLQDSTESQEAYVDLPTPTEDTDSSDVGLGQLRTQTSPASESAGASDSTRAHGVSKEGECVSTARDPGCVQGLTYFASNSTITSSAVQGFKGTSQDWSVFDRQSVAMFTLSSSSSSSSSSQLAQMCPNVSLSPLLEHRLSSLSSVSSGRNSSFDDADAIPTVVADVLVVSHGGLLKELVAHFIDDFHCKVPGGKSHALRICPNTGVSRFMVTLGPPGQPPAITCLLIHDKDHLKILQSAGSTTWEKSLPPI
ncbi:hypothetical protein C0Q70_11086 [Pomacea canaliculata]|uniref:Uncharacterized protein n=1 Tax=Pomacea canaliculata TaxID=400727 RepID=A0A2T7P514_POMCA|nr:hypothetical protein C0Q70_11086 [Pomacea canaliculata]